jgi:hypothetical protein
VLYTLLLRIQLSMFNVSMVLRFLSIGPKLQQEWAISGWSGGRFTTVLAESVGLAGLSFAEVLPSEKMV